MYSFKNKKPTIFTTDYVHFFLVMADNIIMLTFNVNND